MSAIILRRRKLGLTSCREICKASETGLTFVRNDQATDKDFEGKDLVIRWGCTSSVPVNNVLNKASAIHKVSDKSGFRETALEYAPYTVFTKEGVETALAAGIVLFMRPQHHSQGKKAYVIKTMADFDEALVKCGPGWYASELIDKIQEVRVFIVSGKVVWVANKIPGNPEDVTWNVAQGGKFENIKWGSWHLPTMKAAVEAFKLSGLDFGGVDMMLDKDQRPYLIEINSAPSQTSPYRQSCTAKAFDYVVQNGKDFLEFEGKYDNWRDWIHPAIWSPKNAD